MSADDTSGPFAHDPADADRMPDEALSDFETAKAAAEEGEGGGLGFVTAQHDKHLIVEVADAFLDANDADPEEGLEYVPQVRAVLNALGEAWMAYDPAISGVRLIYRGELPDDRHGGPPVVLTLSGTDAPTDPTLRVYDRGYVAMSGRHVAGSPTEELHPVDETALTTLIARTDDGE